MGDHYHRGGGYPPGPPRDFRRDDRYYGNPGPDHFGPPGGGYRPDPIKQERDTFFDRRPMDSGPPMHNMAMKTEFKQEEPEQGFRGPNASGPAQPFQNRKRQFDDRGRGFYEHREDRRGRSPQGRGGDDEDDEYDDSVVVLDNYNSDLHFKLSKDRFTGFPLTMEGFAYLWSGGRATHGVNRGRVCFEIKVKEEITVGHLPSNEPDPHVVRVGWSLDSCSTQLGEEPLSYGFGGTAKKSCNMKFEDYGDTYGENDVIGCYIDFETRGDIEISFSKNGRYFGTAFRVNRNAVGTKAFFPHILVKNCCVEFNFGQREEPFASCPPGFTFIQHVPQFEKVRGTTPPKNKAECEILMMVGLPGAGKTTWAMKHSAANPDKKYNILGTNAIMEKMKVMGLRRQRNYAGRWEILIQQATKCLNQLIQIASRRKRNYILDQTNVYGTAQRRKMRPFEGFQRKAIVICPTDADLEDRIVKRTDEEGKDVPDSAVLEMKANFTLPEAGDFLTEVTYIEMQKEEAQQLVLQYNAEGKKAGPPPEKKFRGRGGGPPGGGGGRGDRGRDYTSRFDSRDPPGENRGGFAGRGGFRGGGGDRGRGFSRGGGQSRWSGGSQDNGSEPRGGFGQNSQQQSSYSPGGNQGGGYSSGGGSSSNLSSYGQGQQSGFGQGGYSQGGGGSGGGGGGGYGQGGGSGSGGGYGQGGGSSSGYGQGAGSGSGYGQGAGSGSGGYGQSSGGYSQGGGSSSGYSSGGYSQGGGGGGGGYSQGSGSSGGYNQGGSSYSQGSGGSYNQSPGSGAGYSQSSGSGYNQGGGSGGAGGGYSQSSGGGYGSQSYNSGSSSSQSYGGAQSYSQGYSQTPPQSSSTSQSSYNQGSSYSQPYQQSYGGGQQWSQLPSQGQTQTPSPSQSQPQGQSQWSQWNYGSGGSGSYDQSGRYGGTQ